MKKEERRLLKGHKKKLVSSYFSRMGRNSQGRITVHYRGGGSKKLYRNVAFKYPKVRNKMTFRVLKTNIYDPQRTSFLALLVSSLNGVKSYILAPAKLKEGSVISHYSLQKDTLLLHVGDSGHLINFPEGSIVNNVESLPGHGGVYARAAGTGLKILKVDLEKNEVLLLFKGKKKKILSGDCCARLGLLSNIRHKDRLILKAGRSRRMGIRPKVRGVARNPVDHPHGGGHEKSNR